VVNFQQSVDVDRPHTCLTVDPKRSGQLVYRYDDDQSIVTVPNIWYNQSHASRVAALRWDAQNKEDEAAQLQKRPPAYMSQAAALQIAERLRASAAKFRSEADRMEAAGSATHPVAASHMALELSL
jgi:hypothetical protein